MAGSVEVYGPTIANIVTADCEGLKSYQAQLQSEVTRTASMTANELESEFKAISAALDKRTVALGKAEQALKDKRLDLALDAMGSASDLLWHAAVFSANPTVIGVAAGVEVTAQTGKFVVQAMRAKDTTEAGFAVAMHVTNRTKFVVDLVKAQKQRPIHERYIKLAKGVFKTVHKLQQTGVKFTEVQTDIEQVRTELTTIQKEFFAVVVNNDEMRKYRAVSLEGARDFIALIRSVHANSNCGALHVPPASTGIVLP